MRIKIAYLIEELEPGGAERIVVRTALGLDRERFDPVVICTTSAGRLAAELERGGVRVVVVGKRSPVDFRFIVRLIEILRAERPAILHAHLFTAALWGRIAAFFAAVPRVVVTEHSLDTWKDPVRLALDRILARSTARIIAVSRGVENSLRRNGIPAEKIRTIYQPVFRPEPTGRDPRDEFRIAPDEKIVLYIGRLSAEKQLRDALRAFRGYAGEAGVRARFVIVGDGPDRKNLEKIAGVLGVADRTVFTGFRTDTADFIRIADVLIISSMREGLPLTALEAMALAKPVLATDVGGVREAVRHGVSGLLVGAADVTGLEDGLRRLLSDATMAAEMGRRGKDIFEETFAPEKSIAAHAGEYVSNGLERE